MNSKTEFVENISSPEYDYLKSFLFEICRNEEFSIQKLTFWNFSSQISIVQENVCFRIWFIFFWKFHFKIRFPMKKFAIKSCLLKWARKVKNLLSFAEHIESKRFCFRCEFFIETWFLCKNWIQKLSFWKIFLLQNMFIRKILYSKSAGTKNSQFKNRLFEIFFLKFPLCRKTFASEFDSFFSENFISNIDFQWKSLL